MDLTQLTSFVSLLAALSVASERLVEIIKGLIPWLNEVKEEQRGKERVINKKCEGWRRAALHTLAVLAGIFTAWLASGVIPPEVYTISGPLEIFGLGLLVSGGSGFWNSILSYLLQVKDLKKLEVEKQRKKL